jgi:pantoate--beta-alanine ligase
LIKALLAMREKFNAGERDPTKLEDIGRQMLGSVSDIYLDYLTVRDRDLQQPKDKVGETGVALVAAKVGSVRLLDNVELGQP